MNNKETNTYLIHGIFPVLGASILWAFGYLARKVILLETTPITLTMLTSVIVSLFLLAIFRPNIRHLWNVFITHPWKFSMLAISGVVLGTTLMYVALYNLDLGIATVLEKVQPIFTLFLAAFFLKETLPLRVLPYCAIAIISSLFIYNGASGLNVDLDNTNIIGIAAVLSAAFFWSVAGITGRSLMQTGLNSQDVTLIRFILASLFMLPIFLFQETQHLNLTFSTHTWALIIMGATFATGGGYLLYYAGMKHVDASTAAFIELTTPVASIGLGILFLSETFSLVQMIFISFLLFSTYKISIAKSHKIKRKQERHT